MSVIEEREEEAAILEERLTCLESTVAELAELIRERFTDEATR